MHNQRNSKLEGAVIMVGGTTELDVDDSNDNVHNDILETEYVV